MRKMKFVSARAPKPARESRALPNPFNPRNPLLIVDLIDDFEAHLAGGAGDYAKSSFVITPVDENDCTIQRVIG